MGETTCKVFTPLEIVKYMLDKIGYIHNLYGKKKFLKTLVELDIFWVKLPGGI